MPSPTTTTLLTTYLYNNLCVETCAPPPFLLCTSSTVQRWYARDAASAVQQQQQQQTGVAPFYGYVVTLDLELPPQFVKSGVLHKLKLWSAEEPTLYMVVVKLKNKGQVLEAEGCQVRG